MSKPKKREVSRSVRVIIRKGELKKIDPSSHSYFAGIKSIGDGLFEVIYKGKLSIGELRNVIASKYHHSGVVLEDIIAYFGRRKYPSDDQKSFYDFACRVELATIFTEIVVNNKRVDDFKFQNCWSGEKLVYRKKHRSKMSLRAIILFNGRYQWMIAYHTGGELDLNLTLRTTLDAVEYRLQQSNLGINAALLNKKGRSLASKSGVLNFLAIDWNQIPLVAHDRKLGRRINEQLKKIKGKEDSLDVMRNFLLDSGLYKAVIESIGITVP